MARYIYSPLIVAFTFVSLAFLSLSVVHVVHADPVHPGYVACDLDDIDCGVPLDPSDALFLAARPDAIELARRTDMRRLSALEPVAQRTTHRRSTSSNGHARAIAHRPDH